MDVPVAVREAITQNTELLGMFADSPYLASVLEWAILSRSPALVALM